MFSTMPDTPKPQPPLPRASSAPRPALPPRVDTPLAQLAALRQLAGQAERMSLLPLQSQYTRQELSSQRAQACALAGHALALLRSMERPRQLEEISFSFDGPVEPQPAESPLDDLIFMTIQQLMELQRSLSGIAHEALDPHEQIARSARLRGFVLQACASLERELTVDLDLPTTLAAWLAPAQGLAARAAFATMRDVLSDVALTDQATLEEVTTALRRAGTFIARLRGKAVFAQLYVQDQVQLISVQARALTWLRDGSDALSGVFIWRDIESFLDLLRMVNHRQSLVEHDQRVLHTLRTLATSALPDNAPLDGTTRESLRTLYGAQDQLAALGAREDATLGELRRALR